jgi:hypothetical protein
LHKYEVKKISDLVVYENNPRTHSDNQISQLVGSIQEFGFTNPVLIDADNNIIAGHGRTEAATLAGLDEVPCIILSGLSDDEEIEGIGGEEEDLSEILIKCRSEDLNHLLNQIDDVVARFPGAKIL